MKTEFIMRTALKMGIGINKKLLFSLVLIASGLTYASRPEPTARTMATKAEALYSDNNFVGFKTSYVTHVVEMAEIYNAFYCRYIEPYVADMLGENDTIFVISQFDSDMLGPGNELIYMQLSYPSEQYHRKYIGILKGNGSEIVDKDVHCIPIDIIKSENVDWALGQFYLSASIFSWEPPKLINLFCNSPVRRTGSDKDSRSMNIYRVVKEGDKITEYASLCCNAQTKWQLYGMLCKVVPLSGGILFCPKTALPPETVEKTILPR